MVSKLADASRLISAAIAMSNGVSAAISKTNELLVGGFEIWYSCSISQFARPASPGTSTSLRFGSHSGRRALVVNDMRYRVKLFFNAAENFS
jgi:hypothetical protein